MSNPKPTPADTNADTTELPAVPPSTGTGADNATADAAVTAAGATARATDDQSGAGSAETPGPAGAPTTTTGGQPDASAAKTPATAEVTTAPTGDQPHADTTDTARTAGLTTGTGTAAGTAGAGAADTGTAAGTAGAAAAGAAAAGAAAAGVGAAGVAGGVATAQAVGPAGAAGDGAAGGRGGKKGLGRLRVRGPWVTVGGAVVVLVVLALLGYIWGLGPLSRLNAERAITPPAKVAGLDRITDPEIRSQAQLDQTRDALSRINDGKKVMVEAYGSLEGDRFYVLIALRGRVDIDKVVADSGATPDKVKKIGRTTCIEAAGNLPTQCYRGSNTLTVIAQSANEGVAVEQVEPVAEEAFKAMR